MSTLSPPIAVTARPQPLIVTTDPALRNSLLRLAAAASAEVRVATDPVSARPAWSLAPFVLLGSDMVEACVHAQLSPRAAVILVAQSHSGLPPHGGMQVHAGSSGATGTNAEPVWRYAEVLKAEHVAVLPGAESWLVDRLAEHATGSPTRGRVVTVLGGRGGAGTSVLATALAVTARRRGLDTMLVDADPLGGGVDLVLGWERMQGLRWPDLVDARGRVHPPALVGALPGRGSLAVLSFDRSELSSVPAPAMAAAIDAGRRGRDLVVVDLPRRFDESSSLALTEADRAYLLVPAELRACAAARRVAAVASAHCSAIHVVVRLPAPGVIEPEDVSRALDLPLAGVLRSEPRLVRAMESGSPPAANGRGPLAEVCRALLASLLQRDHQAVA